MYALVNRRSETRNWPTTVIVFRLGTHFEKSETLPKLKCLFLGNKMDKILSYVQRRASELLMLTSE